MYTARKKTVNTMTSTPPVYPKEHGEKASQKLSLRMNTYQETLIAIGCSRMTGGPHIYQIMYNPRP